MPEHKSSPDEPELRKQTEILIGELSEMTPATVGEDEVLTAPIYYAYRKACFYFFSRPASRHIREALASRRAAGAIAAASTSWGDIRGIQMTGTIEAVSVGCKTVEVLQSYFKKSPFTSEFFQANQRIDPTVFFDRFQVEFYKLTPDLVCYLDNSIRFGFKAFKEKIYL